MTPAVQLLISTVMAKLDIITLPDPILRQTSVSVARVDDDINRLFDDMLETMYGAPGVGLAAVQVSVPKRMVVVDIAEDPETRNPLCMANPVIVKRSDTLRVYEEGCLSMPDVLVEIERPEAITIEYIDRKGEKQTLDADGLLATVIQHEVDHLDGKLIIDFMSRLKRDIVVRRFKKQSRQTV